MRVAIAVASGAAAVVLVGFDLLAPGLRALLLAFALGAWAGVVALGARRGGLPLRPVLVGITVPLALAVVTPSHHSLDVFSYAMYGRMAAVHHVSPYDAVPADFPEDPVAARVGPMWRHTPDIYGPAFTAAMVVAAPVVGTDPVRIRLVYQALSALALVLVLALLWRMTRSAVALVFVGLNPLATVSVVNGGHPDAVVALMLLVALALALRRRVAACGLALALAAAVNASALVAAAAVAVWALRRWSVRDVARLVGPVALLGVLPYLLLPGWLANAHAHQALVSRQSVWRAASVLLVDLGPLARGDLDPIAPTVTRVAFVALLLAVLVRHTGASSPAFAMAAAVGAFVATSPWVMPWYVFAALPLLALERPGALAWALGGWGGLVLVGDQLPRLSLATAPGATVLLSVVVPVVAVVTIAVAIVGGPQRTARRPSARAPVAVG